MNKKNILTIRIPEELKNRIEKTASEQGVSINQFALYVLTKELAEFEANEYMRRRIRGKSKEQILQNYDAVMEKIQERDVPSWDAVP